MNRRTLIDYLRRRREAGDRLGLASFQFNGHSGGYGNFEFTLRRSVPGIRHGDWLRLTGKGAAACESGSVQLIVMSIGPPELRP